VTTSPSVPVDFADAPSRAVRRHCPSELQELVCPVWEPRDINEIESVSLIPMMDMLGPPIS
jgi:hypothetical protein